MSITQSLAAITCMSSPATGAWPSTTAIRAATLQGAQVMGMEKDIGTLEAGKAADVIAIPGDPSRDISVMSRVAIVMKDGTIYRR